MRFETKAIHVGQEPETATGAIIVPIFQTSTYVQASPGDHKGYEYSRTGNPTRTALEACLASLEEARFGLAFASGMAAVSACMNLLRADDHVICSDDVYGGTFRIFDQVYRDYGLSFAFVDTSDIDSIRRSIGRNTRMVWVETPTNPMLKITDIKQVAELCKERNLIFVVDNTFLSPYFQKPIVLGADIVVHSTTKFLGGHSDVVGGAVVTNDEKLHERLAFCQNAVGAVPGPFDCFLVLRGLKTLALRMGRHDANTRTIAEFLSQHPRVKRVYYPGLPSHPGHDLACRQATGHGSVVSFVLDTDLEGAKRFCSSTRLFALAESLGGVESLIEHPAIMTHASVPPETREKLGITDSFVRISVGIEHVDDLIDDLNRAFQLIR